MGFACGDDDGGGGSSGDGGISLGDLNDRLDGLGDDVNNLNNDIDDLNKAVDEINSNVDDLSNAIDDINDRLEPRSCSEGEACIPDGFERIAEGAESLVRAWCELHLNCCTDGELDLIWGAGITSVDQCVDVFMSIAQNGLTPDYFDYDPFVDEDSVLYYLVDLVFALNEPRARLAVNEDGLEECLESLRARECPGESDGEVIEHCDPEAEQYVNPCDPHNLVVGTQVEGGICGLSSFDECGDGLVCRYYVGPYAQGICARPAEEGDGCTSDWQCDPYVTDLYCNIAEGECQERADEGEPCAYVDPHFTYNHSDLNPYFAWTWPAYVQNPSALAHECKAGLACDPISKTCVSMCSEGWICYGNSDCVDGMVCNRTEVPNLYNRWGYGVCLPPIEDGDPCTSGSECASGRCVAAMCAPTLIPEGGDCEVTTPGEGELSTVCETEVCAAASTTNTSGKCATWCDNNLDCPDTHYCREFYDGVSDYWYACDLKRANGADCDGRSDEMDPLYAWHDYLCASNFCDTSSGQCADKVDEGDPCPTGEHSQCPDTQYCNSTSGNCEDFLDTDDDCSSEGHPSCGPGNYCYFGDTTCQPLGDEGADCSDGQYCDWWANLNCVSTGADTAACHVPGQFPVGASCDGYWYVYFPEYGYFYYDTVCETGFCSPADYTCQETLDEGDECDASDPASRCGAGLFCAYDLDADPETSEGECAPAGSIGDPCDPRYGGEDCLGGDCELHNGAFVCGYYSKDPERIMCGGAN